MSLVRPAFTAAIFMAAFLLFWVQPLFGKMMLPMLGGSPAVWLTAMVFYQGALLMGYLYAHGLTRLCSRSIQVGVHLGLLLAAVAFLPFMLPADWQPAAEGQHPAIAILAMMTSTIGLPLVVLSASSPLLQKWFADSTPADPYPLYAASNAGSMVSLLLFPLLLEVLFPVRVQTEAWFVGFLLLVAAFVVCMAFFMRGGASGADRIDHPAQTDSAAPHITWTQRGKWLVYAFVPSSLLLGVTQYITTDIGSVALMWIVPLALYLLTFILAFSTTQRIALKTSVLGHLILVAPLLAAMTIWGTIPSQPLMILHITWFFLTALMCHQVLFSHRPDRRYLTQFYLVVSLGGFLGGVFNALVAPALFPDIWEYPLMVILALWLRPSISELTQAATGFILRLGLATFFMAAGIYLLAYTDMNPGSLQQQLKTPETRALLLFTVLLSTLAAYSMRSKAVVGIVASILFIGYISAKSSDVVVYKGRSFFGVYTVQQRKDKQDPSIVYHVFKHGTTQHGAQRQDKDQTIPRSYYHPNGVFGSALRSFGSNRPLTVAAVGLGTGALSCYKRPEDHYTFFEIDPAVVAIAQNSKFFTYLRDCAPNAPIVIGDARLTLQQQPQQKFDVIILDAFSSDAIPMHLLTREALALYRDKLKPDGMIFYHTSNRHLDLRPVLTTLARMERLDVYYGTSSKNSEKDPFSFLKANAVIIARRFPDTLRQDSLWRPIDFMKPVVWTDDYSNIISVLK